MGTSSRLCGNQISGRTQLTDLCPHRYSQKVAVCAPTGIAATHVNGTTIHSATGIGVPKCQEDFRRMHQGFRKELWTKLVEVLIIDEISMLSGEWLDNLERMLRELTHYYGRGEFQQYLRMPMKDIPAFGGIHGVGSTTKGKGGKCFKCQQVGHWAAECPN